MEVMETWKMDGTENLFDSSNFLITTMKMFLGIGIGFQFPLAIFFIVKIGLIQASTLANNRGIIIILILIMCAFLTPPEPLSMIILALPIYIMFEISLLCCKHFINEGSK